MTQHNGFPQGFTAIVGSAGIKSSEYPRASDILVVRTTSDAAHSTAAGMFTQSRFAGPSVMLSRETAATGHAQAAVVISKNANVATGDEGLRNANEVRDRIATAVGCPSDQVFIASTGVIGRQYPMDNIREWLADLSRYPDATLTQAAEAIMTTDTFAKTATAHAGPAMVCGIAKGVGMIEPNMATLITMVFTDAVISPETLRAMWGKVIERTFNAVSIDTDTSTSDTAIVMASGVVEHVDIDEIGRALYDVALSLTKQVARDGEGAETLIEVHVDGARDNMQAKRVAKAIVNSPLVKTAVHGADPNWGRVAMAIGKCHDDTDIEEGNVTIRFGAQEVFPQQVDAEGLNTLSEYLRNDEVLIHVSLGIAKGEFTVYGCDLTDGYVRINADYTT
jgi:glutamate N-acetyltransferase / amino-acid N-acetyltransferase